MSNPPGCVFCGAPATFRPRTSDELTYTCGRCGNYSITGTAESLLRDGRIENPGAVSGWVRRQNAMGDTPRIGGHDVDRLRLLTKPPFRERTEQYLIAAAKRAPRLDQRFNPGDPELIGASYSDDIKELVVILDYLRQEGLMTAENVASQERLTPKGYISADELCARRAASKQAFVAMWFNDATQDAWANGLQKGIASAGYEPLRIDAKQHVNKICDEIIAEIRRSRFVVADYTGHRSGVYYEAGFASGLGLTVIPTCRKDEINQLHFDVRQYNCIDWQTPAELASRLQARIDLEHGRNLPHLGRGHVAEDVAGPDAPLPSSL